MTAHEERLRRLVHLRDLQHRAAVADLRVSYAALHSADDLLAAGRDACEMARYVMSDVLRGADQHNWLMNRADATLAGFALTALTVQHQHVSRAVEDATSRESEARCAARQMQIRSDRAKCERDIRDARLEQAVLDEAGRRRKAVTSESMSMFRKP
jgi:hypothetical protein